MTRAQRYIATYGYDSKGSRVQGTKRRYQDLRDQLSAQQLANNTAVDHKGWQHAFVQ